MILRALIFAIAGVIASQTQAQTIIMRSGEHYNFTRLVMRIPNNTDWSVTQNGSTGIINLGLPEAVFDTTSVFSLIPRDRITDLRQEAPGQPLRIDLGCECRIDYFQQSGGYLVVDVREGIPQLTPPSPTTIVDSGLPLLVPLPVQDPPLGFDNNKISNAHTVADLARILNQEHISSSTPQNSTSQVEKAQNEPQKEMKTSPQKVKDRENGSTQLIDIKEGQRTVMINDFEQRLLQQIDRASQQGLVDVDTNVDNTQFIDPLDNRNRPLESLPNIAVTSAVDRETGLLAQQLQNDQEFAHCIKNSKVALHKWDNTHGRFDIKIGDLRGELIGEFDQVNPNAVIQLAKTYLYYGFGAEALSTLSMLPDGKIKNDDYAIFLVMAHVIDGKELPRNHIFSGQQSCPRDSAFWAIMADKSIKNDADTDAIQQAFAKLPPHTRAHLGPEMSTLFANAGDPHIAKAALRSVERSGVDEIPDLNLAKAAIANLEGKTGEVADRLASEVTERSQNAPLALVDLITLSFNERKALSPDVPDLAASYELESRDTPLGENLRQAQVTSLALTGRFDEAFDRFENITKRDGPTARKNAAFPFFTLLTERADDLTFLKYGMSFTDKATASEAADLADLMSRRLLNLGFTDAAATLLNKVSFENANDDRRLMNAEIALANQDPQRALIEVIDVNGPNADLLRAKALWMNEDFDRASEYLLAAEDLDEAARGFWHSQDLESAEALRKNQAPFSEIAELTEEIETAVQASKDLPPLAEARALIESSTTARNDIKNLLNRINQVSVLSE